MHIAQVAPLTEAIPPKLYGGTERVVSWLTEELIALGHEVTLFASGDSDVGAARRGVAARLAARRLGARSERAAYADARAGLSARGRIRFPPLSPRLLSVLAVLAAGDAVRHHLAWPSRSAGTSAGFRHVFIDSGRFDFQCAAAAAAAGALGAHRASRPAGEAAVAETGQAILFRLSRPHRAGKGHRSRHPHRAALRRAAQSRRQGRCHRPGIFRRADQADDARRPMSNISARSTTRTNRSF